MAPFTMAIPYFAVNGECLLQVVNSLDKFAKVKIATTKAAEYSGFVATVSYLAVNGDCLFIVINSFVRLANVGICSTEVT